EIWRGGGVVLHRRRRRPPSGRPDSSWFNCLSSRGGHSHPALLDSHVRDAAIVAGVLSAVQRLAGWAAVPHQHLVSTERRSDHRHAQRKTSGATGTLVSRV